MPSEISYDAIDHIAAQLERIARALETHNELTESLGTVFEQVTPLAAPGAQLRALNITGDIAIQPV